MDSSYPAGWEERDGALEQTFELPTYMDGIDLACRVAGVAEAVDHHPEITIGYRRVTFRLRTHSSDAITERDPDLAARTNALGDG